MNVCVCADCHSVTQTVFNIRPFGLAPLQQLKNIRQGLSDSVCALATLFISPPATPALSNFCGAVNRKTIVCGCYLKVIVADG